MRFVLNPNIRIDSTVQFKIKKGLDIPINGKPTQSIEHEVRPSHVAVLGADYVGLKPTMKIQEGDVVQKGQVLFEDKKNPGVLITAPSAGTIKEVNRGAKRALISVVIESSQEQDAVDFGAVNLDDVSAQDIRQKLIDSGMWSAFRTRPFSKIPAVDAQAKALFVTATDTNPLAADPQVVIKEKAQDFEQGLRVLSKMMAQPVYVCVDGNHDLSLPAIEHVEVAHFSGPHPAGLVGTHIHFIHPVNNERKVWHVGYQDVMAIAKLFETGEIYTDRVVALGGAGFKQPVLARTTIGAQISELVAGQVKSDIKIRYLSGSVFNGQRAFKATDYLRRYDNQITALVESNERQPLGWIAPGSDKYSFFNVLVSALNRKKTFDFNTLQNGSPRAMVPLGHYERVVPLDILPTQLLRAIVVGDTDTAQSLGCLELDEEDLALCSFVCQSKSEFGPVLRDCLTQIEREG